MSTVKQLLDSLLWDIYGKQQVAVESSGDRYRNNKNMSIMATNILGLRCGTKSLEKLSVLKLVDICAILKVELRLMGYILERVLINRDRMLRHQEILCEFVDAILHVECHDAHPKMRFSLSPPHPKATTSVIATSPTMQSNSSSIRTTETKFITGGGGSSSKSGDEAESADDAASDYKQWLHAMKLVARLPGGMPPEFRRKLWLSLADKYLKSKNVDWAKEEEKCFCEKWREDDEELGIQIVKDLHRTGSNLCTGPAGSINQAKLKRILLGYARYSPEVGYCQGFNMLGALILQVMDKEESESMKVMIYLVEGVLPPGYFCGSMGGLQADMGVFRELMTSKLPRLAKHLQKLQGPIENAYEPPLTNVFTMQWFLTMFCTCLPMTCVLRVWDLVLIEGSDVLLRTALVLWSLLEERILRARTADDFYCKMGSFSSELLNGHLIDSNGLIEKVVQLGPIPDIQRLRDKHLYNIAPLRHKQGLQLYFDDEEPESDEESRLAVASVWGIPWGRRGSTGQAATSNKPLTENKDRIALDISLLKKQYDRLRERQKQAHIILTTACSTAARQGTTTTTSNAGNNNPTLPVNQLLMGRSAILINKGRRIGPPPGAIPPARKPSLPAVLQTKPPEKQLRRGETLHWRDTDISKRRRDSLTWKEIKADRIAIASRDSSEELQPRKLRTRLGKSDSSSYSDESDDDDDDGNGDGNGSSTDTSLCDDDDPASTGDKTHGGLSSVENSPKKKAKTSRKQKELSSKLKATAAESTKLSKVQKRPKSWAPTSDEIPFMLMTSDSPVHSGDEKVIQRRNLYDDITKEEEDSTTECDRVAFKIASDLHWSGTKFSPIAGDLATTSLSPLHIQTDVLELPVITSTSQLSPLPDIARYLNDSAISPLPTPKPLFLDSTNSLGSGDGEGGTKNFDVSDDGVTNEYFERVNSVERPNKLELFYSLSEEDSIRNAYESDEEKISKAIEIFDLDKEESTSEPVENVERTIIEGCETKRVCVELEEDVSDQRHMKLLDDYSEKSSVACIAEAKSEISSSLSKQNGAKECAQNKYSTEVKEELKNCGSAKSIDTSTQRILHRKHSFNEMSKKRRDPRRLTITHWSTIEAEAIQYKPECTKMDFKEASNFNDFVKRSSVTVIPSTADLEERFSRLKKQLSLSSQSAKNDKSNKRFESNLSNHLVEICDPDKPTNDVSIPSTEDLDSRFTALEKEMSSPKASVPKNSIDQDIGANGTSILNGENGGEHCENHYLAKISPIEKSIVDNMPSAADLENHYNTLERLIDVSKNNALKNSMDLISNGDGGSDKKATQNAVNLTKELNVANIPSTESLETRFTALEKQMSSCTASIAKSTVPFNSCADDTDRSNKDEKQESEIPTPEKNSLEDGYKNVNNISSTKDSESRFTALQRQMSSSKTSVPKNSIELNSKADETMNSDKNGTKKDVDSQSNTQIKENKIETSTEENVANDQNTEKDTKPRLSKIPSTAELEDRFNALERKMSTSKSNAPKVKKEPPDPQASISKEAQKELQCEKKFSDKNKSNNGTKEVQETTAETKKPPSTEELEKRFDNLEKQLSTSQNIQPEKSPRKEQNDKEPHDEAATGKTQKSPNTIGGEAKQLKKMQSFHDKCKSVNEKIGEEQASKTEQTHGLDDTQESTEDNKFLAEAKKIKVMQSFQTLSKPTSEQQQTEDDKKPKVLKEHKISDKRRASEPPTTEDLENRYEALKRRMSSKTMIENGETKKRPLQKSETVEEALERIEKEVFVENIENIEIKDDEPIQIINQVKSETANAEKISPESLAMLNKTNIERRRASEPPTTEELEKRYEKLKRRMSTKAEMIVELEDKTEIASEAIDTHEKPEYTKHKSEVDIPVKDTVPHIPTPPPMQCKGTYHDSNLTEGGGDKNQRQALVEELQSKMKPNDENLKPSHVNPNQQRRIPNQHQQRPTKVDETSETHATTASKLNLRKKGEPWQIQQQQSHKMVRRFSDLPSRADLENRVEFLEQQLSMKLIKQRSASDSEVASRTHFVGEGPSSSFRRQHNDNGLEDRVMALEKQLSENSLKLLEAMRMHSKGDEEENMSPEIVNAEMCDPEQTGKELVRYTHYREIEDPESNKPINISINIKMHVNKDTEKKERMTVNLPTTEELEKRLEILEQHVARPHVATTIQADVMENEESNRIETSDARSTDETTSEEKTTSDNQEPKVMLAKTNEKQTIDSNKAFIIKRESVGETQHSKETEQLSRTEQSTSDQKSLEETSANICEKEQSSLVPETMQNQTEPKRPITEQTKSIDVSSAELEQIKQDKSVSNENKSAQPDTNNTSEKLETVSASQEPSKSNDGNLSNSTENIVINTSEVGQIDPNNKTMVLLLNNEPKAVKVRRLTRANTEELEDLFQALEKQLSERNLIKSEDGKLKRADTVDKPSETVATAAESKAISDLTKEIQEFTSTDKEKLEQNENYDWGVDPVKHHLKRKTVYLPSTKELEARFRSLERQIKLLEDVENIDVEQRLNEIERKIKLQYSLSHEKDLSKYLELCEGKLPDDELIATTPSKDERSKSPHTSPGRGGRPRSPYTSPSRSKEKTPHSSPSRIKERSPYTTPSPPPSRTTQRSPYISPARQRHQDTDSIPCIENLEYRYRVLDLVRSKSKENLSNKSKLKHDVKKQAIHPLEMLLDPSPDDSDLPTTGELEHRIRVLDGKPITPSPPRKLLERSPTIDDIKRQKLLEEKRPRTPIHNLETLVVSPTKKELPTAEELEARMRALEKDHKFDFKMQKNFQEFNQKLKNVVSPSLSFEEFKATKSREQSPKRSSTPKSALKDHEGDYRRDDISYGSTSPKMIRFRDEDHRPRSYGDTGKMVGNADGVLKIIEENSKMLHRILKKTLADSNSSINELTAVSEGLDVFGTRLMRETSPLRRTGTHTGIPLRTDDNINDRLNSIKNTIKSIDTLCEEKPYRKEKCQRYIDSLFNDSVYFASPSKKTSLDDLAYKRRSGGEYGPSIRVSDHSQRPSEHYLGRSIGSAESLRSTSPLRAASPLHHRSTRDLHRDISPRRRRGDEEREEYESRVRRVNLLPNYLLDDSSEFSRSSLTKFYKVDNELDTYKFDDKARSSSRSASRSPLRSPYGSRETMQTTAYTINNTPTTTTTSNNRLELDRPVSPYRQTSHNLLGGGGYDTLKRNSTPIYNPGKLEIRHTTVTSTFYDRFLTEKQIEKSLSRPPSRSPVVSPSVASKSYLDIPMASSYSSNTKSNEHTPTTPVMSSSSIGITGYGPLGSATNTSVFGYNSLATNTTAATAPSISSGTLYTATYAPTGNSSAFSNSYLTRLPTVTDQTDSTDQLRIRSCDNILMQLKSSTATLGAGAGTTEQSTAASNVITSYNDQITTTAIATTTSTTTTAIISNYTNFLNQISAGTPFSSSMAKATTLTTASDTTNTTFSLSSSGIYYPVLPLSVRSSPQLPEIGIQSNVLLNNNPPSVDFTNLPKS